MHAGFAAIRSTRQMNCELRVVLQPIDRAVRREIARVLAMWSECRAQVAAGDGAFLFGAFCAADAFYAPMVRRFVSYGIECPQVVRRYIDALEQLPSMRQWMKDALTEREFIDFEEPYRDAREKVASGEEREPGLEIQGR